VPVCVCLSELSLTHCSLLHAHYHPLPLRTGFGGGASAPAFGGGGAFGQVRKRAADDHPHCAHKQAFHHFGMVRLSPPSMHTHNQSLCTLKRVPVPLTCTGARAALLLRGPSSLSSCIWRPHSRIWHPSSIWRVWGGACVCASMYAKSRLQKCNKHASERACVVRAPCMWAPHLHPSLSYWHTYTLAYLCAPVYPC
jgi:hypothetical protein